MYTYSYTYDAVGNRTQMVDGGTTNYTYDANNKMTAAGNIAYTYDSNGNTLTKTVGGASATTYAYDWANQLTGITYPDSSTASFTYGPKGERVSKTESGTMLYYWHDGVRVILEGTFSGATWTRNARYTVQGDSYYDPLISMRRGDTTSYYLYDQIGSTRKLINSGETVTDTYQYEGFGNLKASTGSTTNPYQYVGALGYHKDSSSGLMHLGARYYAPEAGRFMTLDPARPAGNDPPGISGMVLVLAVGVAHLREIAQDANAYGYVINNPTSLVDPEGKGFIDCIRCVICFGALMRAWDKCDEEHQFQYCDTDKGLSDLPKRMIDCLEKATRKDYVKYCEEACVKCVAAGASPVRPKP